VAEQLAFAPAALKLLAPFRSSSAAELKTRDIVRVANRWRRLPHSWRLLPLEYDLNALGLRIRETRVIPSRLTMVDWQGGGELALSVVELQVTIVVPHIIVHEKPIALVGLHGLGRRFERSKVAVDVRDDLRLLVAAYAPAVKRAGEFRVGTLGGGGAWICRKRRSYNRPAGC
jgi:hypothetical protein